jgi:ABC-type glutathione transport system ATPase component
MKSIVENKDILMLIGMTGAGKSLTTNFLRGAKI